MSRYAINSLATQDLKDIADYFTENSIEAGERFCRGLDKKCKQLVTFLDSRP